MEKQDIFDNDELWQQAESKTTYDELNIIDWPLHVFDNEIVSKMTKERSYVINTYNKINRNSLQGNLIIEGNLKYYDEDVLLALMKISSRDNFASKIITLTTLNDLLKILKWTRAGKSYAKVMDSLKRLVTLTIETNIYYNRQKETYEERKYHILERISDHKTEAPRYVEIVWDSTFYLSLMSSQGKPKLIRPLDYDTYLSLDDPLSKKLYRIMDKKMYKFDMGLIPLTYLCYTILGVSNTKPLTKLRFMLKPALEELLDSKIIKGYDVIQEHRTGQLALTFWRTDRAPKDLIKE